MAALEAVRSALGNRRVLVVDDEEAILRVMTRVLARAGYEVTTAHSGAAALEALGREQFDAMVSDIMMPDISGVELLERTRAERPSLPVVLMTSMPTVRSAVAAVEHQAFGYLDKPLDFPKLLNTVERATAKRIGRQPLSLAPEPRRGLAESFEQALATMRVVFQPIVAPRDRKIVAFEALLRPNHPAFATPPQLITAAESLDRLCDLARTVRESIARAWAGAPEDALLFVNLHPLDLLDDSLGTESDPLHPFRDRIVFELTERAPIKDVPESRERIDRLRALGFRIAVDDLGAGYAALSSLAALEPEFVKLDMSLVRDIDHSETKRCLVSALATLSRQLEVTVIAEGVETEAERDTLLALGCGWLQGYYFARPAPGFGPAVFER